jgi:hypothetical protein
VATQGGHKSRWACHSHSSRAASGHIERGFKTQSLRIVPHLTPRLRLNVYRWCSNALPFHVGTLPTGLHLVPIDIAIRTRCALAHPVLVQAYASCPHMLTFVVPQISSASRSSLGAQTLRTSFPELVLAVLVGTAFHSTAMNPEMEVSARLPMATTQHSHLPRSQWLLWTHRSHRNRTRWRLQ